MRAALIALAGLAILVGSAALGACSSSQSPPSNPSALQVRLPGGLTVTRVCRDGDAYYIQNGKIIDIISGNGSACS